MLPTSSRVNSCACDLPLPDAARETPPERAGAEPSHGSGTFTGTCASSQPAPARVLLDVPRSRARAQMHHVRAGLRAGLRAGPRAKPHPHHRPRGQGGDLGRIAVAIACARAGDPTATHSHDVRKLGGPTEAGRRRLSPAPCFVAAPCMQLRAASLHLHKLRDLRGTAGAPLHIDMPPLHLEENSYPPLAECRHLSRLGQLRTSCAKDVATTNSARAVVLSKLHSRRSSQKHANSHVQYDD